MNASGHRSPEEVFEDHLRLRLEGNLAEDLRRNYAEDVVLLTVNSNARGHDAIRMSAERLNQQLPDAEFNIVAKQVNGPYTLLIWSAKSAHLDAVEGADSFVIREGKIVFQSIHYVCASLGTTEMVLQRKDMAQSLKGACLPPGQPKCPPPAYLRIRRRRKRCSVAVWGAKGRDQHASSHAFHSPALKKFKGTAPLPGPPAERIKPAAPSGR